MKPSILLSAAALLLTAAIGARADTIYYSLESTTERGIKFAPETSRYAGKYEAHDFKYTLKSPRDVATGQATGKRQHGPVKLTRKVSESSPQWFAAMATNDTIKSITIDFLRPDPRGVEVVAYSFRLTNVQVSEISQYYGSGVEKPGTQAAASRGDSLYEDISLVFQRIEVTSPGSKSSAMDEWISQR
jgi:type VI secretion system secreted protein Hcp